MSGIVPAHKPSLIASMAEKFHMEPKAFSDAIRATCLPKDATNEEFATFMMVAKEYGLNPVTREIYAFPKKGGGIQPIVSIDGWMNLINSHPNMDGMEFEDKHDKNCKLTAINCRIYRKDRSRPISVTEYMDECKRSTDPWQRWPSRMLRHKAAIQCARYAFGFAGIIDPDEAERYPDIIVPNAVIAPPPHNGSEGREIDERTLPVQASILAEEDIHSKELGLEVSMNIFNLASARLGDATNLEELAEVWATDIEPMIIGILPPEREYLIDIYRKNENRLST